MLTCQLLIRKTHPLRATPNTVKHIKISQQDTGRNKISVTPVQKFTQTLWWQTPPLNADTLYAKSLPNLKAVYTAAA